MVGETHIYPSERYFTDVVRCPKCDKLNDVDLVIDIGWRYYEGAPPTCQNCGADLEEEANRGDVRAPEHDCSA